MKVLISGAGIAGLSLAPRLRQRGLTPVVERSPRLRDGGYMLGLSDPGLDAADRMGVADALRAARHAQRQRRLLRVAQALRHDGGPEGQHGGAVHPERRRRVGRRRHGATIGGSTGTAKPPSGTA
jgi:2-polyprenyl-6-methoxyphenol hydroxylase-like FAD-dependent oxidoreductase